MDWQQVIQGVKAQLNSDIYEWLWVRVKFEDWYYFLEDHSKYFQLLSKPLKLLFKFNNGWNIFKQLFSFQVC